MFANSEIIELDFYHAVPGCGSDEDIPFYLSFSPALKHFMHLKEIKVIYYAGYKPGKVCTPSGVPADLASACLELADWNMRRYKGRRVGMTGNVRGRGKDGEHFEMAMPENVRQLLEPYKRKLI